MILTPDDIRIIREFLKACEDPVTKEYQYEDETDTIGQDSYGAYYHTSGVTNVMDNIFQKYPNVGEIITLIASFQKNIDDNEVNGIISILEKLPKDIFDNLTAKYVSSNYCVMFYETYLVDYFQSKLSTKP